MNLALVYLAERFLWRIWVFLDHWYLRSARRYSNFVLNLLSRLDYHLACRITLRHLFEPLYKDYSIVGYILGFLFRAGRLILSGLVYLPVFLLALGFYILWILIPPLLIYLIFL